jgi:Transglutaminase-like superfamily
MSPDGPLTLSQKAALAREISIDYVRARWWLRRGTVAQAAFTARLQRPATPVADRGEVEYRVARRLGAIVDRSIDHLPGDTRCLTRSLVLLRMLARRGMAATLVLGVLPAPSFAAHAWVELEGHPLMSPIEYATGRLAEL